MESRNRNSVQTNKTSVECTESNVLEKDFLDSTYVQAQLNSFDVNIYNSDGDIDDGTVSLPSVNSWGD